jgi:large subunit ribosomal protein L2
MALKLFKPVTASRRYFSSSDFKEITKGAEKPRKLMGKKVRSGGRNSYGRMTNINIGGGHKKRYRIIDFKRDKLEVPGIVDSIQYDPNRTSRIALINYKDGEKRYILAPIGLEVGQTISAGEQAEIKPGNALPLRKIPTGVAIHNIEIKVGRGAQLVRSAGTSAQVVAKEGNYVLIRMPSGEMRKILQDCFASIGQLSNIENKNISIGKAGRSRWLGIRPHNRGTSKNPVDHPLGGGEGKSKGGRHPVSPTGVPTKGYKTRTNKRTSKFIVRKRKK